MILFALNVFRGLSYSWVLHACRGLDAVAERINSPSKHLNYSEMQWSSKRRGRFLPVLLTFKSDRFFVVARGFFCIQIFPLIEIWKHRVYRKSTGSFLVEHFHPREDSSSLRSNTVVCDSRIICQRMRTTCIDKVYTQYVLHTDHVPGHTTNGPQQGQAHLFQ